MYPSVLRLANQIGARARACHCDEGGRPYIEHPRRLATNVNPHDHNAMVAARLSDVFEGTTVAFADLAEQGIPAVVIEAVELLTRSPQQPPADYYGQIRHHRLIREVTPASLAGDIDASRLSALSDELRDRLLQNAPTTPGCRGRAPGEPCSEAKPKVGLPMRCRLNKRQGS